MQSQTDNINITSFLERLIVQLEDQVSALKSEFDTKDKRITRKIRKKHHEEISFLSYKKWFICCSNFIRYQKKSSLKTQHGNMNMNQDSINSITKAQNITQAITSTDVLPTSKENK